MILSQSPWIELGSEDAVAALYSENSHCNHYSNLLLPSSFLSSFSSHPPPLVLNPPLEREGEVWYVQIILTLSITAGQEISNV